MYRTGQEVKYPHIFSTGLKQRTCIQVQSCKIAVQTSIWSNMQKKLHKVSQLQMFITTLLKNELGDRYSYFRQIKFELPLLYTEKKEWLPLRWFYSKSCRNSCVHRTMVSGMELHDNKGKGYSTVLLNHWVWLVLDKTPDRHDPLAQSYPLKMTHHQGSHLYLVLDDLADPVPEMCAKYQQLDNVPWSNMGTDMHV